MKPILFSTPMVQAILDGRKTMTRRVIKAKNLYGDFYGPDYYTETIIDKNGNEQPGDDVFGIWHEEGEWRIKSKYQPGDILWVRETWAHPLKSTISPDLDVFVYRADGEHRLCEWDKWRPSIFMPREASRIFLRVTEVRAERVQDISESDAQGEGSEAFGEIDFTKDETYRAVFRRLWDSINAKRGYGWDTNPWVWVINFERCEKPEAPNA